MEPRYNCHMLPKRIILLRHGESEGNVDPAVFRSVPDCTIPLTDTGHKQCEDAGKMLNKIIPSDESIHVYCSPYKRTRQTLDGIKKTLKREIKDIKFDPRIREREWAGWFGDYMAAPRDRKFNFFYRMPEGESCADVYNRMMGFIDTLDKDKECGDMDNIVIVSHGTAIRIFLMCWFREDEEYFYTIPNPKNCDMFVLTLEDGEYVLTTELKKARKGTVL